MKKSIGLLSALVVSTTFIVNCQKAPDKRRVRPSGGLSGVQTQLDKPAPTKACNQEVLNAYSSLYKSNAALSSATITADSSAADKEAHQKAGVEVLAKCKSLIPTLKLQENEGCVYPTSNRATLTADGVIGMCNDIGVRLKSEVNLDNEYANAAEELKKANEDAKVVEDQLLDRELVMSKEARTLLIEENTNGAKFLADGKVSSYNQSLKSALAASQTVCTFLETPENVDENKETTLKITKTQPASKAELQNLDETFNGKSTLLITTIKQEGDETDSSASLLCLNLDPAKLTVEKITSILGKEIASAPVKVSTEVTSETSETVKTTSATVTVATKEDVEELIETAEDMAQPVASATVTTKSEVSATVTVKPTASATVTTVATVTASASVSATAKVATEETEETTDAQTELAILKEKADRLESEAVAAQAEVKKLETEKAKAEDIDQAKAKARLTRESANTAKAEYDEAAQATKVAAK